MAATADCERVLAVLADLGGPTQMLAAGLPFALREAPAQRHPFQEELVSMVGEALKAGYEGAAAARSEAAEVEVAQVALQAANTISAEAAAAHEAAAQVVLACEGAWAEAAKNVKQAEKDHAQAEKSSKVVVSQRAELCTQRDSAAAVVGGPLSMLRDGGWEEEEVREDAIAAVTELLATLRVEGTLLAAMPGAFRRLPSERKAFDAIVAKGVEDALVGHLEKLESEVAAGAKKEEESCAEALGLWAILDVTRAAKNAAALELSTSEASLEAAKDAVQSVAKDAKEKAAALEACLAKQKAQDDKIEEFTAAMDIFGRLRSAEPAAAAADAARSAAARSEAEKAGALEGEAVRQELLVLPTPMVA